MEAPRGVAGRRPIIRLSRTTPPRGELAASSTGLGGRTPGHGDAHPAALKPVTESLLSAVDAAAAQLGTIEVDAGLTAQEILNDEQSRASAARWRSGNVARRLTAALARMVTSLQPWSAPSSSTRSAAAVLEPVRPKPVRGGAAPSSTTPLREPSSSTWPWSCFWPLSRSRLVWIVALMLLAMLFPKLIALLLGNLVRFVLRGVATLAGSLLQEIFFQASALIGELEQHLIAWLSNQLGLQGPATTSVPLATALPGSTSNQDHYERVQPPFALPARPMDVVTWVLLAYNAYLQRQRGGGWGTTRLTLPMEMSSAAQCFVSLGFA